MNWIEYTRFKYKRALYNKLQMVIKMINDLLLQSFFLLYKTWQLKIKQLFSIIIWDTEFSIKVSIWNFNVSIIITSPIHRWCIKTIYKVNIKKVSLYFYALYQMCRAIKFSFNICYPPLSLLFTVFNSYYYVKMSHCMRPVYLTVYKFILQSIYLDQYMIWKKALTNKPTSLFSTNSQRSSKAFIELFCTYSYSFLRNWHKSYFYRRNLKTK